MTRVFKGKRLLSENVVAQELGLRVQTLRNWRYLGVGPAYFRIGARTIRYDEEDLRRFIDQGKVESRG